jgi:hypothetical protein
MKPVTAMLMIGALALSAGCRDEGARAEERARSASPAAMTPIRAEVISVDASANTITVRELAAGSMSADAPAATGVMLPVAPTSAGRPLADLQPGDRVDVTCEMRTGEPARSAGAPLALTECSRITRIDPSAQL